MSEGNLSETRGSRDSQAQMISAGNLKLTSTTGQGCIRDSLWTLMRQKSALWLENFKHSFSEDDGHDA